MLSLVGFCGGAGYGYEQISELSTSPRTPSTVDSLNSTTLYCLNARRQLLIDTKAFVSTFISHDTGSSAPTAPSTLHTSGHRLPVVFGSIVVVCC